jgi:hypothetical protein
MGRRIHTWQQKIMKNKNPFASRQAGRAGIDLRTRTFDWCVPCPKQQQLLSGTTFEKEEIIPYFI